MRHLPPAGGSQATGQAGLELADLRLQFPDTVQQLRHQGQTLGFQFQIPAQPAGQPQGDEPVGNVFIVHLPLEVSTRVEARLLGKGLI